MRFTSFLTALSPLVKKDVMEMLAWLSANWINLILIAVLALIVALLIRGMVRDRKAGKRSCGCNCASCGACPKGLASRRGGCSACGSCKINAATMNNRTNSVSGNAP